MLILSTMIALLLLIGCFYHYNDTYPFPPYIKLIMGITTLLLCYIFGTFHPNPSNLSFPIEITLIGMFVYLIATDLLKMELPDGGNLIVLCLGVIHLFISEQPFLNLLTGAILFAIFFSIALTGGLGGGDIKYVGAFGLFMEPNQILLFLWIAFLTALIFGLILIFFLQKGKDKKEPFPFGPFLILASLYILFIY